jgi:DHA3 family macrolide efflux protein-like MFS transporter
MNSSHPYKDAVQNMSIQSSDKVWNRNFFLLWQGQMMSGIGDYFYLIALGFWVLASTGSTALMTTIMAASYIPQVVIAPFAGVIVDRLDRKWMIVAMDAVRGIVVLFISLAAFAGILKIWMVLTVGLCLGVSLSFFNPAVRSAIPDIIPKTKLIKANAAFSMVTASAKIIGDSLGGILYQFLGVPLLFLINSISYLFSAFTEIFIKIPIIHREDKKTSFLNEMKEGFSFTWKLKGLRYLFLHALGMNFTRVIALILILALFQREEHLGAAMYGIAIGTSAAGAFAGFLFSSAIPFKSSVRFFLMCLLGSIFSITRIVFPFFLRMDIILPLMFISGVTISISLNLFEAGIPLSVPPQMRGKVFSLLNAVTSGVWPFGMIVGGILAEFFPIPVIISTASVVCLASYVLLFFAASSREIINYDPLKKD